MTTANRVLVVVLSAMLVLTPSVVGLTAAWTDWTIDNPDTGEHFEKSENVSGNGQATSPEGVEVVFRFYYRDENNFRIVEDDVDVESQEGAGGTYVWTGTIICPGGEKWHLSPYDPIQAMFVDDHGVDLRGPKPPDQNEATYTAVEGLRVIPD